MMRRLLIAVLAIVLLVMVRRAFRGAGASPGDGNRGAAQLVRDRVCNTYIQESKAIRLDTGGTTLWFCSEECRSRHLAGTAGPAALTS